MKTKLHTINVVESIDGYVYSVRTFRDNKFGNSKAEKLFVNMIREHCYGKFSHEKIDSGYVENGYWESGNYSISLVHSS